LNVKVGNFFGGMDVKAQRELLKDEDKCPRLGCGRAQVMLGSRVRYPPQSKIAVCTYWAVCW
jgi:hypothetical protein